MKKSRLIQLLSSSDEEEVLIIIDGIEYEIDSKIERLPEKFDGFYTAYPAALGLKPTD